MANFTLDIQISPNDLPSLEGENIIILKNTTGNQGNVAWVSFSPFQNNTVSWAENYGVYASQTQIEHGATIKTVSTRPTIVNPKNYVSSTEEYPFTDSTVFGEGQSQ